MDFPSLLTQFKHDYDRDSCESPLDTWNEGIYPLIRSLHINLPSYASSEEIFDVLSAKISNLKGHSKEELVEICKLFFKLACDMKETCENMQEDFKHKSLECTINLDNSLKENERIEQNYMRLLSEHNSLEVNYTGIQQSLCNLEHQVRESGLKLNYSEILNKSAQKTIDELKSIIAEKEKAIQELNKKVKMHNSINRLKEMHSIDINSKPHSALRTPTSKLHASVTPRAKFHFEFDKPPETDWIKEQMIKRLKEELQSSEHQVSHLEDVVTKLEKQNEDLIKKIKQINSPKFKNTEDDEDDNKFETLESLRDEIIELNSDFAISSRVSMKPKPKGKEIAVQCEIKPNDPPAESKRKKRYSCFTFF